MAYYGFTHEVTVSHPGLGKTRTFRGRDYQLVHQRATNQQATWDRQWERRMAQTEKWETRDRGLQEAKDRTEEARDAVDSWRTVLTEKLDAVTIGWEHQEEPFPEPKPVPEWLVQTRQPPPHMVPDYVPNETESRFRKGIANQILALGHQYPDYIEPRPKETDFKYAVSKGLGGLLNTSRYRERVQQAKSHFLKDAIAWDQKAEAHRQRIHQEVIQSTSQAIAEYQQHLVAVRSENEAIGQRNQKAIDDWNKAHADHQAKQASLVAAGKTARADYAKGLARGVDFFIGKLARQIEWPVFVTGEFDWQYFPDNHSLVIDLQLPNPDEVPTIREVKYIQSRQEHQEVLLKEKERAEIYDGAVYQLVLKMLHDIVGADQDDVFESITVNGIVESISKATGKEQTACILSIHVTPNQIHDIDFASVDPKACFKGLKGVGSSRLHALAAVPPIVVLNKKDKRFVVAEDVTEVMAGTPNVATMDWKDFEHLVRELFEKEFGSNGSEVKITRASRDAGVDAVIFDPDPIRGGKIVVQAKRYTHTVDVSAVRDLYGTVLNEGAMTGILVTTSEYGPDAYAFAKDKPLKLLTGGNLLHLLTKHGYKARLDLKEAKAMLKEHGARAGRIQR